ncbi:MAG: hypothetical protein AAGB29_07825 [Planctomycetota bacterium]
MNRVRRSRTLSRGLTLIELCAALCAVAILLTFLLPVMAQNRAQDMAMESNKQLRGIHQACVMYAQTNNSWFPGIRGRGELVPADDIVSADVDGGVPAGRYALLLRGNFFTPGYIVGPFERNKTVWRFGDGDLTDEHFSYAMLALDLDEDGQVDGPMKDGEPVRRPGTDRRLCYNRTEEWAETLNTLAPVISDRNLGEDVNRGARSIQSSGEPGSWIGGVVYNDNHVVHQLGQRVESKFGRAHGFDGKATSLDNLFAEDSEMAKDDAVMVFQDAASGVRQR